MKYIFLIGFLIFNSILYAQYDGYLGKNFFLHYTTNGSYNSGQWAFNEISRENSVMYYYMRHNFNMEYLQARNKSILGGIGIYRLGFGFEDNPMTGRRHNLNIKGMDFVFHQKYYRVKKGAISPFGGYRYFGGGLSYNRLQSEEKHQLGGEPLIIDLGSMLRPVLFFGFGKQSVLGGSLVYNIGMECGLVVPGGSDLDSETIKGRAYRRIAGNHLWKVKFGITFPGF